MAIPARHVRRAFAEHGLRFHHEILQNFVERSAHVNVAIGKGRAVVQDKKLCICARLLNVLIDARFFPLL